MIPSIIKYNVYYKIIVWNLFIILKELLQKKYLYLNNSLGFIFVLSSRCQISKIIKKKLYFIRKIIFCFKLKIYKIKRKNIRLIFQVIKNIISCYMKNILNSCTLSSVIIRYYGNHKSTEFSLALLSIRRSVDVNMEMCRTTSYSQDSIDKYFANSDLRSHCWSFASQARFMLLVHVRYVSIALLVQWFVF